MPPGVIVLPLAVPDPALGELSAFALAIGFSPLHIALLLLLLLGPSPLRRGTLFVGGWMLTSGLAITALLTVGHGLLLTMERGSSHRTGLDLLAAGALFALALKELLSREEQGDPPAWTRKLDQFCALPLPLLLAISAALQVCSPDDLFLYAKAAGALLSTDLARSQELTATLLFAFISGILLLLPLAAVLLLGPASVLPMLERSRAWLVNRGDLLVGLVSLGLAAYLGWQGVEGLRMA
ncbi:MAG: GAP family protein [Cyanobacteriota bacterium]|nr:GAP family protein [Cyanobacteriota bacterium]